jgi:hypothetical protein
MRRQLPSREAAAGCHRDSCNPFHGRETHQRIQRNHPLSSFEYRGEHRHDTAVQIARSLKRKLSLELYDAGNKTARSMAFES